MIADQQGVRVHDAACGAEAVTRLVISHLWPPLAGVVQHGQVEPAQPLAVGDHVDGDDTAIGDRKRHDRKRLTVRGDDDAGRAVDERRPRVRTLKITKWPVVPRY